MFKSKSKPPGLQTTNSRKPEIRKGPCEVRGNPGESGRIRKWPAWSFADEARARLCGLALLLPLLLRTDFWRATGASFPSDLRNSLCESTRFSARATIKGTPSKTPCKWRSLKYVYIYIYVHIYIYIFYIYETICIYIYMCVCVYIYIYHWNGSCPNVW